MIEKIIEKSTVTRVCVCMYVFILKTHLTHCDTDNAFWRTDRRKALTSGQKHI